jgi:hypothetical protein
MYGGRMIKHSYENPEYRCWVAMRNRVRNKNNPAYHNYGGRGITICPTWDDFDTFYSDMGPRPSSAHSIDRIDNDGSYSPSNCRWATSAEQNRNRRSQKMLTVNGETRCISEWTERIGCSSRNTIMMRLKAGWTPEEAVSIPVRSYKHS